MGESGKSGGECREETKEWGSGRGEQEPVVFINIVAKRPFKRSPSIVLLVGYKLNNDQNRI